MDYQNALVAATVGLLTCPDECLGRAWARCDGLFDASVLHSRDKRSVAVRSDAGVTPLREWVMRLRGGGLLACGADFGAEDNGEVDAHIMAGFVGGRISTLQVRHAGGSDSYRARMLASAVHAMTVGQFADLINAQGDPAFFWRTILARINEFHACNGIVEVAPDELGEFLRSDAAAYAWNVTGDQIMREAQVEAMTFGEPFTIPAPLADLVEKVVPLHDATRPVWLDACDEDAVTGAQLYQLITAQAFHAEIWRQCADPTQLAATLGEDFDLTEFPDMDAGRWGNYLQGLDAIAAELVRDDLLALIRLECQRRGCEPMIPAALQTVFGPNEEERRRLYFRFRLQHDMGCYLKRHPSPWRMYVFDKTGSAVAGGGDSAATVDVDHQQRFDAALDAIKAFAVQVQSPFVRHFTLAKCLAVQARADGPFDRAAFRRICRSNNATDGLAGTDLVDLFAAFGWRSRRVFGLAAVNAADVFGAMGSWNDQCFEGDVASEFAAVSSQLLRAMNGYLASLLAVEVREAPVGTTPVESFARRLWKRMSGIG